MRLEAMDMPVVSIQSIDQQMAACLPGLDNQWRARQLDVDPRLQQFGKRADQHVGGEAQAVERMDLDPIASLKRRSSLGKQIGQLAKAPVLRDNNKIVRVNLGFLFFDCRRSGCLGEKSNNSQSWSLIAART
ncbi:hypothetical protein NUTIK01_32880 [Novosphingobium sp. IK01]|uniref:Uncharacterized protein n=1 Tax=Novosphingobium pituita TaxID=3056842 RepID=A0ABQ6PB78_9SPHN|nr:hypothetical protein NUTIK01_32880 [Novosphingobium sp. IK01]